MKRNYLLIVVSFTCLIGSANAQYPNWLWAKGIGGINNDEGHSIAIDASRNVYTTGYFKGTVDFDPGGGVFNLISLGYSDVCISKLDSSGDFVWAIAIGGTTGNDGGIAIAIDASGNIYTTGYFQGTVDFDPGGGVFNLTTAGGSDIFISKLDSLGNFIWAKAMSGTIDAFGNSIALDPGGSGDVYTTGEFQGTVDFDPGAGVFNLTSAGSYDVFIFKLNSSGNFIWAKSMGSNFDEIGYSIAIDTAVTGAVYTSGTFGNTTDFDPGAGIFNLTPVGSADIFISKLDSSGNFIWAKAMGGINQDESLSLAIDPAGSGNVYTTGNFSVTVDFDPGAGVFNLSSAGAYDIFISKLDSSGNFIWAKAFGGTGGDWSEFLALDASGNVYTTGRFFATVDFDPGAGVFNLTAAGLGDIFISKLDSSGNFVWAKAIGGTDNDWGQSIAFDVSGKVHLAGWFRSSSITFGSSTLTNAGFSGTDIFIAKLDTTATIITGNNDISASLNMINVFPNPATNHLIIVLGSSNIKVEVTITDITGKIIYTTIATEVKKFEVSIKDFAEGVYIVQIKTANFIEAKKLIVAR